MSAQSNQCHHEMLIGASLTPSSLFCNRVINGTAHSDYSVDSDVSVSDSSSDEIIDLTECSSSDQFNKTICSFLCKNTPNGAICALTHPLLRTASVAITRDELCLLDGNEWLTSSLISAFFSLLQFTFLGDVLLMKPGFMEKLTREDKRACVYVPKLVSGWGSTFIPTGKYIRIEIAFILYYIF